MLKQQRTDNNINIIFRAAALNRPGLLAALIRGKQDAVSY